MIDYFGIDMQWNHLIFEGYCSRKWSIKKNKYMYQIIDTKEPFKTKKIPNPKYDKNYKTPRKPRYCQNRICFICWEKNCPHLAMCPVNEKEYEMFMKAWWNWNDDTDEKQKSS